jgi:lipopolysaccharide/colanic/teichoic acid biosynthesis glycosyltransferase
MLKRFCDLCGSSLLLVLLSPLFVVVAIVVKLTSRGPVIFKHQRLGLRFQPFFVYKFRSMTQDAPMNGGPITFGDDPRITPVGKVLRKSKIDELPQLFNVLKGDMSLVGPRPEVQRYVEMFPDDYTEILSVRPGITDLASIRFLDEQTVLGRASDPASEYANVILPEKIRLAREYVRRQSLRLDIAIMFGTLVSLFRGRPAIGRAKDAPSEKNA